MAQVYKNPGAQAAEMTKVPPFNKEQAVAYWNNYGDGFVDDNYDAWLKQKGRPAAQRRPLNPEFAKTSLAKQSYANGTTNKDQWINDEEWLKELWEEEYPYIEEYMNSDAEYPGIDADYERSWGPVDTPNKYIQYQKWLKGKK